MEQEEDSCYNFDANQNNLAIEEFLSFFVKTTNDEKGLNNILIS